MPDGYELRELQPEHAEIVGNCMKKVKYPDAYDFNNGVSPDLYDNFIKDMFAAFGGVGIFVEGNPLPVGFQLRKPGMFAIQTFFCLQYFKLITLHAKLIHHTPIDPCTGYNLLEPAPSKRLSQVSPSETLQLMLSAVQLKAV